MRDENHVSPILAYNDTTNSAEVVRVDLSDRLLIKDVSITVGNPTDIFTKRCKPCFNDWCLQ
jgi:hypothetical protein